MKKCIKCNKDKPLGDFNKGKAKDGRHSYCRECSKAHYRGNMVQHKANVAKTKLKWREENRKIVLAAFAGGCVDCGTTDMRVLEFDHVIGNKKDNLATLVRAYPPATVKLEIAKCEVRCRNCHAIVTYERNGSWRSTFYEI